MKIPLELNFTEDKVFLNFWDSKWAHDIIAELWDGHLWIDGRNYPISFAEFADMVKKASAE